MRTGFFRAPLLAGAVICCAALASQGVSPVGSATAATDACVVYANAQMTRAGDWVVERETSNGDGNGVAAHVASSPQAGSGFFCLTIECKAAGTSVYLEAAKKVAVTNRRAVVGYSVDDRPTADQPFGSSSDGFAVGLWTSADATTFVKALAGGESLSVTMPQAKGSPLRASFAIKEIDAAIAPVRAACHW